MFHLRSPLGQYKLTFDKAKEACAKEAATVATYNQLAYAQKVGPQLMGAMQAGSLGEEVQHPLNTAGTEALAFGGKRKEVREQQRFVRCTRCLPCVRQCGALHCGPFLQQPWR